MKVTFSYTPLGLSAPVTPLVLALGERLSPLSPVDFAWVGVVQESHPMRADAKVFIGRGGRSETESFVAQKEHADHWAAMVWSRITLQPAIGHNGTLLYEGDTGGRIKLVGCVLGSAVGAQVGSMPPVCGFVTSIRFTFMGGTWQTA